MPGIWITALIFWVGLMVGFLLHAWMHSRFLTYNASGTIVVDVDQLTDKTVYSLILEDYPDELRFKKTVVFKVDHPEERSNRE